MSRTGSKTNDLQERLEKALEYDRQARAILLEGERFGEAEQAQYHLLMQQCATEALWALAFAIDELKGRDAEAESET